MPPRPGRFASAGALSAALLLAVAPAPARCARPEDGEPVRDFHTSPACWTEPRIFHQAVAADWRQRVEIGWREGTPREGTEPLSSPNRAYRAWVEEAAVVVDVERAESLVLAFDDPDNPPHASWINEKLLFVRVWWGRILASDLVVDVERGVTIYEEAAVDGGLAFQQFQGQCGGACPPCGQPLR